MIDALSAEFPRDAISWRSQSLNKDGTSAMALAYIDARDVMDRLDGVCGPANWQDRYEFHGARTVCYLSIRLDGEWITKADGAGDSDVEAEKGAISDALKRAAVKWGIGRYLYALPAPWVPCESYDRGGKRVWKRWTKDPWECVKGEKSPAALPKQISAAEQKRGLEEIGRELIDCATIHAVNKCAEGWRFIAKRDGWSRDYLSIAADKFSARKSEIEAEDAENVFPGDIKTNEYANNLRAG